MGRQRVRCRRGAERRLAVMKVATPALTASVLTEPMLRFGFGQSSANPKHGLFLFGTLREHSNPTELRCGVIGTPDGLRAYRSWVERIQRPIRAVSESNVNVFFPGFRELFNCSWSTKPAAEIPV